MIHFAGDPPFTFKWIRGDGSTIDGRSSNGGTSGSSRSESSGSSVVEKGGMKVETSGDYAILSLENVQVSQAGNYTCSVSNEGDEQSYTSTLRVNGK